MRRRFEIRFVDKARRVYVFVESERKYCDAVLMADIGHFAGAGDDFVVWDSIERRVLYDTRDGLPLSDD